MTNRPIALVLHGGAGTYTPETLSPALENEIRTGLEEALNAGVTVLERGGSARDAVVAAISVLEDAPVFNAGKGAVFTADGTHELDAALMVGSTKEAGAVCGLTTVKNPIRLAEAVLDHSGHVLLAGPGAEKFADTRKDIERVAPTYFSTPHRKAQLDDARAHEALHGVGAYFGTVGAVALDLSGELAAGTSTGGLSNKRYGRVGDSPILGAGTYASSQVAVSATGSGEYFLRSAAAHDVVARVEYRGDSLTKAAHDVIFEAVSGLGGDGGLIALSSTGEIATPCNISSLSRAWLAPNGTREVHVFTDIGKERPRE